MLDQFEDQSSLQAAADNWRPRVYLFGAAIGMFTGLLASFLYVRAAEESSGLNEPKTPETGDAVRLGLSLLGILRTIAEWGTRS